MGTPSQPPQGGSVARKIAPLLLSTTFSVSGNGALLVAGPLLAASLTNDPGTVSAVTAASFLPWLVFGLPAGALVDRWPRRRVMMLADLIRAVALVPLCVLVATGHATVAALVLTIFVVGAVQCFFDPAAGGIIPAVVGRDKRALERVNSRYWSLDMLSMGLIGPLGGASMFAAQRVLPFVADAASFLVSAAFVRRLPHVAPSPGPHEPVLAALRTSIRHLIRSPEMLIAVLVVAAYNLGYNLAMATFVLYVKNRLNTGAIGFGALFVPIAVFGLLTGWQGNRLLRGRTTTNIYAFALAGQGAAWLLIAVAHNIWATVVLLGFTGVTSILVFAASWATFQRLAPEHSLGRIAAVFQVSSLTAGSAGALLGGRIASELGLTAPNIAAAIILITAGIIAAVLRTSEKTSPVGSPGVSYEHGVAP